MAEDIAVNLAAADRRLRRPRDIGTAGETAVVKYLLGNGFPQAERRALRGGKDCGDITGTPGICWEVKAGDAARTASDGQIDRWLQETETERANAGADLGLLVVARARQNVSRWWCCMTVRTHQTLFEGRCVDTEPLASQQWRTTLESAVIALRSRGWGDAL